MKETSEAIYKFVARADEMRRKLVSLRTDLSEFVRHTDYVLPKACLTELDSIAMYDLDDTNNELKWLVTHLASAMVLCEENKEPDDET